MTKNETKPSFSKSLFSGYIADEMVFPYPEQDKEEKENLDLILDTFNKFAQDNIDSSKFDEMEEVPEEVPASDNSLDTIQ